MGLGWIWMIAVAIAVSIAAFWLYARMAPPEGVVPKGDEQTLAWVPLATAIGQVFESRTDTQARRDRLARTLGHP